MDPKKYYTVCAEPFPIWDIPEQVRTKGQCEDEEICVDGHFIGASIKGLENFVSFFAKCVPNLEGRASAMPSSDRTANPRTPSPPVPNEPNPRPPTVSSTSKQSLLDPKQPLLRPDSAALNTQHEFTKRNTKWRTIDACPGDYPASDWLFWKATCDLNSPRDYTIQCKQRIRGLEGVHICGQTVFLKGQCAMDEICFQKGNYPYAKCVSHDAFASIVAGATEDHKGIGKHLNTRQEFVAKRGNLAERGNVTQQKNWRLINRCFGEHAHWPVDYSACDPAKGPRAYYFRCIEPNATKGQTPAKLLGTGRCEENELCLENEEKGVADCVKHESFVRIAQLFKKDPQKTRATETKTLATATATAKAAPSQLLASRSQPTQNTTNLHRRLEKRILSRLINECPGPHYKGWEVLTSDCSGDRQRDYRIWCRSPNMVHVEPIEGRCLEEEVCVPGYSGPPPSAVTLGFAYAWDGHHGIARCVKHESFVRLARIATNRWKAHRGNQRRSLRGLADGRLLNQCPKDSRMAVWTSVCHPNESRKYFITCRNPHLANFVHRTGQCAENEICVSSHKGEVRLFPIRPSEYWQYGIAKCVKQESFVAAVLASRKNKEATTSQDKTLLSRQTNWRLINECPGKPHLPISNSACDPSHPRRWWVTCEHHEISDIYGPGAIGVDQIEGECEKDEVCVSGYTAPPPANPAHAFMFGLHGEYGIARCVKHESFARIAELANKFKKMEIKKVSETKQRRGLEERTNWRRLNECPGAAHLKVRTSACNAQHPRQYFITCEYPVPKGGGPQGIVYFFGECYDNELCVSGYAAADPTSPYQDLLRDHGIAHCVNHDGFNRIAQLVGKYKKKAASKRAASKGTKSKSMESKIQKRSLEKRNGWRRIDQCPEEFRGWTFMTSVCDSKDPRKYWIICHAPYTNGKYGPNIISRPGQCSETEMCVSGFTGTVPQTPIPAYQVRNFGVAKCCSQQSFVRIARMVTEHDEGKMGKDHVKRTTTRTGNNHMVLQAVVETASTKIPTPTNQGVGQTDPAPRSQKYALGLPLNVCPDQYRGWTVISSSCNTLSGRRKHFRMWCTQDPYALRARHARVQGKCADGEVCVPGAGGTEVIPDPRGRKHNLTTARRAACVSIQKISRIAKVLLDRKARVRGSSAPTAPGTVHNGPGTAFKGPETAETRSDERSNETENLTVADTPP
ncbi:hypothetical protein MMC30_007632 [Trapelia coarctata]|nr:hypothetical protein [Trapelia coarctata]